MSKIYPELAKSSLIQEAIENAEKYADTACTPDKQLINQFANRLAQIETEKQAEKIQFETKECERRANEILLKTRELELKSEGYKKSIKKCKKASVILRSLGTGLGSILAVGAGITATLGTSGIALPVVIPAVIGGIGTVQASLSEIFAHTLIKNKTNRLREKQAIVDKYTNRLYHFYLKASEDKRISEEEMSEFNKIILEYMTEFKKLTSSQEEKEKSEMNEIKFQLAQIGSKLETKK